MNIIWNIIWSFLITCVFVAVILFISTTSDQNASTSSLAIIMFTSIAIPFVFFGSLGILVSYNKNPNETKEIKQDEYEVL